MILVRLEYGVSCKPKHFILDGRKLYHAKHEGHIRATYAYVYRTIRSPVDEVVNPVNKEMEMDAFYNGVGYAMDPKKRNVEFQDKELEEYFDWKGKI